MSWSVRATGKVDDVLAELARQFQGPLADKPAGLSDDGERETVRQVGAVIAQCLGTYGAERLVTVSAYGHMGFANWETRDGAFQNVSLTIEAAT